MGPAPAHLWHSKYSAQNPVEPPPRSVVSRFREKGEQPLKWTSFSCAPVGIDIIPRSFHTVLIVRVQTQLSFFVSVVTRLERLGMHDVPLSHEVRTVILHGFGCFLKDNIVKVKTTGCRTWSESEIAHFEAAHAIGTKARLAFALLLFTGQRPGDVVKLGRQYIEGDLLIIEVAPY